MSGCGCLPFVTVETAGVQDDLRDFLLRGAGPVSVEGPQHPPQPRALLPSQARIRWNGATMQGREEPANSLDPVEAVETKWNDCNCDRFAADSTVEDLERLPVAEVEAEIRIGPFHRKVETPDRHGATDVFTEP